MHIKPCESVYDEKSDNMRVPSRNRSYGAVRREMIQTSINCIQKRLESNVVEEIVQKFLSASSAKELHEPLRSLAGHIPSLDLQQASR